jgi:replicative DNA helicase
MVKDCLKYGGDPRPNLRVGGGGNPLNMLDSRAALSLLRTIEHDKPKLVYVGPVYKMHNDDPDKESVIKKVTDVLDSIRAMGVAIITEAHHTKAGTHGGPLEPSGSNLWTWWPEYGLGLRLADGSGELRRCNLERWRIDRDASSWPHEVESSGQSGLMWARSAAPGFRQIAS